MKLAIEELTVETFATFGRVIERPDHAQDAAGPGWKWWGETGFLPAADRPYAVGYLDLQTAELKFDWAERHMSTVELIFPLGGDCLVYVGPPDHLDEPDRMPDLERFRVFRVKQGRGVLFDRGVWHGAPLALDRPLSAAVLLLRDTGIDDTSLVRFPENPVFIRDPFYGVEEER